MSNALIKGYQISPQQEHLWSLQEEFNFCYCATSAIIIDGNLDQKLLKKTLKNIINRHEILRTNFHCLPEMAIPVQVVKDKYTPSIDEYNLSSLAPQQQEVEIKALFDERKRQHIDFEKDSLLQISLINLSPCRHILLINLPALCADTATLNNLMREINRSYTACLHEEKFSDEPIQYIVVAQWQNELLESEDGEVAREYWRKQNFSGISTLKLPFENQIENQPPEKPKFEPQVFNLGVDPNLLSKLRTLVKQCNTSLPVFLLSCWQVLLWKLIGKSDIIIGTACDGRTDEELEEALGLFSKYLPLKCHLEEHTQFSGLLEQVKQLTQEIYQWQECFTWKQIRASAKNHIEPNYFPICFDFDKQSEKCSNGNLTFSIYKQYVCADRFNLKLSCVERDTSLSTDLSTNLSTEFHYNTNLFSSEDIERLARQFHKLLESVLNNPNAEISKLDTLTNIERQQLLVDFNNTKTDLSVNTCIHKLFEEQTKRTPDAVAVVFEEEQLTYWELNQRANKLAHYLHSLGVRPEICVGICTERSLLMVVALLGILKAGGAYVPLDPGYPKERLEFMLNDAQMSILLTETQLAEKLPEHGTQVICLDTNCFENFFENVSYSPKQYTLENHFENHFENPDFEVNTDNLAYIIYTSGSTGQPKGVMISHRALCNHMLWMGKTCPLTETDAVLQKTPISFDASVWEFYAPLLAGARLVMAQPEGHKDTTYLIEAITKHNITVLQLVPSMLQMLLLEPELEQCHSLRYLYCGGEILTVNLQQRFSDKLKAEVYNLYGPTETCIDTTWWKCEQSKCGQSKQQQTIPIGRPITNTKIYLLDTALQLVSIGVAGELCIDGIGLARGYRNRRDLTSERFIPNPFSQEPGARLYRTGDLARYLSDGNIEYLGRLDHQVKINGFRIELGEIESLLRKHPSVSQVVVLSREDELGSKSLVAYVVSNHEPSIKIAELRSFLEEKLPKYMLPSLFMQLKALPLMSNGKIDRKALLALDLVRSEMQQTFVAPQTAAEKIVVSIWQQILGLEQVGIHDNFFELGGHSLLATQVISRLRQAFQIELPIRCLFEAPTVEGLVNQIAHNWGQREIVEEIAQTLLELEQLSAEEVKTMLLN